MIPPNAYRLKDNNNDDALTEHLGEAMSFFLFLSFSLTFVYLAKAPIKAPRPEHFLARGALGLHQGALLPLYFVFTLSTLVLSYGEYSFLPEQKGSSFF